MDTRTADSFSESVTRPGGGAGFSFAANNNKTRFLNSFIPFQIEKNMDWGWGWGGEGCSTAGETLRHKNKVIQFDDGVGQIINEFLPPPSAFKNQEKAADNRVKRKL